MGNLCQGWASLGSLARVGDSTVQKQNSTDELKRIKISTPSPLSASHERVALYSKLLCREVIAIKFNLVE